jgi:L-aminopeptidase/D-esterase-like protein
MITDVDGVRVGHWTDVRAATGCTAVLFPDETVASGEVRGGAPATREFDLLDPHRLVQHVDAVVLSGGSAFGLAAAHGVMRWLEERGTGFVTAAGPVPIVIGMSLYDLAVGDSSVRPGPDEGYAACEDASRRSTSGEPAPMGAIGAGTGATVGKWRGAAHRRLAGLGSVSVRHGELVVAALVALNAFGDVDDPGRGATLDASLEAFETAVAAGFGNTTLGVVVSNARLDKAGCLVVAQGGHDGLARSLFPPHTRVDGDAMVAAATGRVEAGLDLVRALAVVAVERSVRQAARLR